MIDIESWCAKYVSKVNSHRMTYLEVQSGGMPTLVSTMASVLPGHYAAPDRLADILTRLGKPSVAEYIRTKLPEGAKARSGDLGEILAVNYVAKKTSYDVGVFKLRWSDHREMAMRGDDILGIWQPAFGPITFLKGEVKSRAALNKKTVDEARKALASSNGRPTPHALAFLADRLFETGQTDLAQTIDDFQLKTRIQISQMRHLMFMFTGNNPTALLTANLTAYTGKIRQFAVGLRVSSHQAFIKQIFEKVIHDGNQP